jgi:hypothetical protein
MVSENSIVLIHEKKSDVTFSCYARVDKIEGDIKPGWYNITFKILIPGYEDLNLTLREEYLNGEEFTVGGNPIRIEEVPPVKNSIYAKQENHVEDSNNDKSEAEGNEPQQMSKVIDLEEYKKMRAMKHNNNSA